MPSMTLVSFGSNIGDGAGVSFGDFGEPLSLNVSAFNGEKRTVTYCNMKSYPRQVAAAKNTQEAAELPAASCATVPSGRLLDRKPEEPYHAQ